MEPITKQQKVFVVILILVGLYVFYIRLYKPVSLKIDAINKEIVKNEAKLNLVRAKAGKLEQLKLEFAYLGEEVKEAEQKLPKKKEIANLLKDVTKVAGKYNINLSAISPQQELPRNYFIEIPFDISVTANYHYLALFFAELGQFERIINILNLNIRRKDSTDKDPTDISANFKLVTYVFKEN